MTDYLLTSGSENWVGGGASDNFFGTAALGGATGGTDTLDGGAGDDHFYFEKPGQSGTVDGGADTDTVTFRYTLGSIVFTNVEILDVQPAGSEDIFSATATQLNAFDAITRIGTLTGVFRFALSGSQQVDFSGLLNTAGNTYSVNVFAVATAAINVIGSQQADRIYGSEHNDTLNGGLGADSMNGGLGDDTYYVDNVRDNVNEFDGGGTDLVISSIDYRLESTEHIGDAFVADHLTLVGTAVSGTGNELSNVITGNELANTLDTGMYGEDTLRGMGGDDTYIIDWHRGFGDPYSPDPTQLVTIEESDGAGTDTVLSWVNFTLPDHVENLTILGQSVGATATGNHLNNILIGNGRTNTLKGGGGIDTLDGGNGVDAADFSDKTVSIEVQLNGATSTQMKVGGVGEDWLRNIERVIGGSAGDKLTGDAEANSLAGGAGNDSLKGGAGVDILNGGEGVADLADYSDKTQRIEVELHDDASWRMKVNGVAEDYLLNIEYVIGGSDDDKLTGDDNRNTLAGNGGDDVLYGGIGNDVLIGNAGADTIEGWTGWDYLTGNSGADKFVFRFATNTGNTTATADIISDFKHSEGDKIDLSGMDANSVAANNQAFSFIGKGGFTGVAGQLHYGVSGGNAIVSGDLNGDKAIDFVILLNGVTSLVGGDFVL